MRPFAYFLIIALIFVMPWENVIDVPGLGTVGRLIGLGAGLYWVMVVVVTRRMRRPEVFHAVLALLVGWNLLSVLWSHDVDATLIKAVTWLQLLILSLVVWDLCTSRELVRGALQAYVLGAFIAIGATVQSWMSGTTDHYNRFAAANFNPDGLGLIVALGVPMACYLGSWLGRSGIGRLVGILNYAYIPAAFGGIALTGTRTALLATLPGLLLGLAMLNRVRLPARMAMVALLLLSIFALLPFLPEDNVERLAGTGSDLAAGDFSGRTYIWSAGFDTLGEHPLLGVGAGAFRRGVGLGRVAHNSFLSVAVELGLFGLGLFCAALAIVGLRVLNQPRWEAASWLAILAGLGIGLSALTWEHYKQSWVLLSLAVASASVIPGVSRVGLRGSMPGPRAVRQADADPLATRRVPG